MVTVAELKKVIKNLPDGTKIVVSSEAGDEYASELDVSVGADGMPILTIALGDDWYVKLDHDHVNQTWRMD